MSDREAPSRDRSASPARDSRPKKQKSTGFKWKEKRPRDDDTESGATSRDSDRLHRGYRDRSPRPRDQDRNPERKGTDLPRSSHTRTDERTRSHDTDPLDRTSDPARDKPRDDDAKPRKKKKPSSSTSKSSAPAPASAGPMIIVNVNDRLGTKAAIPCLASDSVKAFKAIVAAHIGRQPHEIMLKRQGERPFKDLLTLEDYGVSSGVQLDLEIDTGD
ncbi:hypothetical protein KC343_g8332 [Hortaea werneckii]|uniref:Ubiquitin-like modifier HUB1 n=1 Tax=Hortaea werneckii TaxID=91943 RepID=A0A3M7GFY8_HORWE|nr:hypothetical protein KC352_g21514 [Hortaea werneckii]KAI7347931.1 hypothetical protein KC320_g6958 [Hortaea werneckii]KAI7558024.1 hypothetical protein KC317_g11269 [Hortaea werneckii]KAI7620054.1 hypothetical protein KC346_g4307 [Hortaea werneckii]KAI7620597.1 hypothetical protein KC343_g8332 [Hortaea werneckii]